MDNLESLSASISDLTDTTNNLYSSINRYYSDYIKNFNFISNNISNLNTNLQKINYNFDSVDFLRNTQYSEYIIQKIDSLEKTFKEIYTISSIKTDKDINNKIFFNIYDKDGNIISKNNKINYSGKLTSMYNFSMNTDDYGLENGEYYLLLFYENANKIYEFNSYDSLKESVISRDKLMQRVILDNIVNKISDDLRNYRIYLVNNSTNLVENRQIILNSIVSEEELDITFFTLKSDGFLEDYKFIIKEELFDPVFINLNISEFNESDIGSILLSDAERDLETGEFTIFDEFGNAKYRMVSNRFGKKETRNRIL